MFLLRSLVDFLEGALYKTALIRIRISYNTFCHKDTIIMDRTEQF